MGVLLPAMGSCSFAAAGERRFAERLIDKLPDNYLSWYDVPVGPHRQRPDFIVFHPQYGLLVLEVKDWRIDTIQSIDRLNAKIIYEGRPKSVANPLEQARQYLYAVIDALGKDPQLVARDGTHQGKLIFPYGHGVVLANITRNQFESTDLREALPPSLVICKDEMTETADAERFQRSLADMWPYKFPHALSLPQIDRIRWHLFPEVRIGTQRELFADGPGAEVPDLLRVMDLQQEQLARSLGEGHRIIHGVAGSGKTLILGYRAEQLAQACSRPILVLCYNKSLAAKLSEVMTAKGVHDKVNVHNFHQWVRRELDSYNIPLPEGNRDDAYFAECVNRLIESVDSKFIPGGQYDAVLIDEGHDFKPEWLKLVVQMVHPNSRSLLVLYDDAQSIYGGTSKRRFTFASVGIEARGRTTILKLNYRNTAQILKVARAFADDILGAHENADDEAPLIDPVSAGRPGPPPLLVPLPSLANEANYIADKLTSAHKTGTAWMDMAVVYRDFTVGKRMAETFARKRIPVDAPQLTKKHLEPSHDSIKLITMHSSKGLEYPLVCIPGLNAMPDSGKDALEEARLLYVAMTRATHELVLTHVGDSMFVRKIQASL